jgi:adenine nucleotide transporter 17
MMMFRCCCCCCVVLLTPSLSPSLSLSRSAAKRIAKKQEAQAAEEEEDSDNDSKKQRQPQTKQTEQKEEAEEEVMYTSPLHCLRHVVRTQGWLSLYRGLRSSLVGVGVSSLIYFFWYFKLKKAVLRRTRQQAIGPLMNLVVASAAGTINVLLTMPIWVIQARLATSTQYSSIWNALTRIYRDEGVDGLYKGLGPALMLVSNPVIQFFCFEQLRYAVVTRGGASSLQLFYLGAIAKAIATVLTYPLQMLKARMQVDKTKVALGFLGTARRIYADEGFVFYRGMSAKMLQTVLNSAFMFVVYGRLVAAIVSKLK